MQYCYAKVQSCGHRILWIEAIDMRGVIFAHLDLCKEAGEAIQSTGLFPQLDFEEATD